MRTVISSRKHACPICNQDYDQEYKADQCLEIHQIAINNEIPQYKIGKFVHCHPFNCVGSSKEWDEIISIKGEGVDLKLLVERGNKERFWVRAVSYLSSALPINPINFRYIELRD